MKFCGDDIDFAESIVDLITVASWEIYYRMFYFLHITEVEGLVSYHGNRKISKKNISL